jgi:hypothetical protein
MAKYVVSVFMKAGKRVMLSNTTKPAEKGPSQSC